MGENGRIRPASNSIIETAVGEDLSLYDPEAEKVVVLNTTASDVWRLCDGEQTFDEIVSLLAAAYRVEEAEIRPDIERTIAELTEAGFLRQS